MVDHPQARGASSRSVAAHVRSPSAQGHNPWIPNEFWGWASYAIFIIALLLVGYLALRPGGTVPVFVYRIGPSILFIAALAVGLIGSVWSMLNRPFIRSRRIRPFICLILVFAGAWLHPPFPSAREGDPSKVPFRLPVNGEWTVFWGGDGQGVNKLSRTADRRWAMHLVVTKDGSSIKSDGSLASDYYAYGLDVVSPAAGRVVRVNDGLSETAPRTKPETMRWEGNYIVIEVAPEEFLFIQHLQRGSILVSVGEDVVAGQRLAKVGYSGHSHFTPEPHVAVHLQDSPAVKRGQAIPWAFHNYISNGERVEKGLPRGGVGARGELLGERVEALP